MIKWIDMDNQKIRNDFPLLSETTNRKPVIYFDNACQTLRPRQVIDAVTRYYLSFSACSGRSMHQLSAEVTREVDQARIIVQKHLNASRKEEIVFTRNTTEGINLVANSINLQTGDSVLISAKEHNSNLIPWQMMVKKKGITLKICPINSDNTFNLDAYTKELDKSIKLVSLSFTSNLDGVTIPVDEIIKKAHRNGSMVMLDAAQAAPHRKINVKELDVDFVAFSGHKMLGPSGTGVLYGKYKLLEQLEPFMVGGDTVSSSTYETCKFLPPPEKFEAGLQDYAGIMGLGAAISYLTQIGFEQIQKQETALNELISRELIGISRLMILGPANPKLRGGIINFIIEGIDSHRIALMLDQMASIMVRSGQHCVHSWFNAHQIQGSVRVSLYFYNTLAEAEIFIENLKKIIQVL
jgi:cysteine desulfurase/selenocysteine lyase